MGKVLAYSKEASIDMANLNPEHVISLIPIDRCMRSWARIRRLPHVQEQQQKQLMLCSLC